MALMQIRIDDETKKAADELFSALGLDVSTAVRMFIAASLEHEGIPFPVKRVSARGLNPDLLEAIEDARLKRNLHGPFPTVEDAMRFLTES